MSSKPLLLCPANFSEGTDLRAVKQIAAAGAGRCALLDVHTDADHNRAVITFAGNPSELVAGVVQAAGAAVEAIDLRKHEGAHPRMGAADVLPFVPHGGTPMADAVEAAAQCAGSIAQRFSVPCFLYEFADPAGRSLPDVRRAAFENLLPDFGPTKPHPTAGATAVGAREPLVAYNVNLDSADLRVAAQIAGEIRLMPYVRALGFSLASRGLVQVSCNLLAPQTTSIPDVFDAVAAGASKRGVEVFESELVGLASQTAFGGRDPASMKFTRDPKILESVIDA